MESLHESVIGLNEKEAISCIRAKAHPLERGEDLDPLMKHIGDAKVVMLGEASHGTHEYYTWRTHITQRLILEKGFTFIAVEGDWPDCYCVNRYVKNYPRSGKNALEVLRSFHRWPTWMWANWEIAALTEWLHLHNKNSPLNKKAGFYGLDVYSLWESMEAIMGYLKNTDAVALKVAEKAFACFEPNRGDEGQGYAHASLMDSDLCTAEVMDLLKEIQRRSPTYNTDHENVLSNHLNARIAVNAEKYYRTIIQGGPHSWNVRDKHMMETLNNLLDFHGQNAKAIVWAHNTHIGDARATDMSREGMYNLGELARLSYHDSAVSLVGFGSYQGSVIASHRWGAEMERMKVPSGTKGSWENILHQASPKNKLLLMNDFINDTFLESHVGHRALGVVYNPAHEKYGNYVPSILPLHYDAFIFLDKTKALHPLHSLPDGHQIPETYPFGV